MTLVNSKMKKNLRKNILNALDKYPDLTQKQICAGSKITEATLSNAINYNDRIPQLRTVDKIKRYFEQNKMEWI